MKKILRAISTMLALGVVAISFLGCPHSATYIDSSNTYPTRTGTVKVKIFNNTTVPFTVADISCLDSGAYYSSLGNYSTETVIAPSGNREFEIECSSTSSDYTVDYVKINGYYNSGTTVAYPYAGHISGDSVGYMYSNSSPKVRINDYRYSIGVHCLHESYPPTINIVMNFVKTTSDDYVLCVVK